MEFQNNVLVKMDKMFFFPHISFSFFYTLLPEAYKNQIVTLSILKSKKAAFYKGHPNFFHTPLPAPPHPLPQ